MRVLRKSLTAGAIALCLSAPVLTSEQIQTQKGESSRLSREEVRTQWRLSETQWNQYITVMQGRRGIWSPGLDPIVALGVTTDDFLERRRLAELHVRTEFERTRKELAFQVEVDRAWQRFYPNTPRVDNIAGAYASSEPAERYALIVSTECPSCDQYLQASFERLVSESPNGLDLHVVGTAGDDALLRRWARDYPSVLSALKNGAVTLNHGDSFADLKHFPVVYRKNGTGAWSREQ